MKFLTFTQNYFSYFAIKAYRRFLLPWHQISYSQQGEDIIIQSIFGFLGIAKPNYLDLGANDPIVYSNTYLFYTKGSHGVCVEANPKLAKRISSKRPKDTCLNLGVTDTQDDNLNFYVFDNDSLSTFSKEQVDFLVENTSYKLIDEVSIPVRNINSIINQYFAESSLNFLSLDCEGMDFKILETIDLNLACPQVICVETVNCSGKGYGEKRSNIIQLMQKRNYVAFADTYVNTIFIHQSVAKKMNAAPSIYI